MYSEGDDSYIFGALAQDYTPLNMKKGEHYWIMGTQLMRNFYTMHDVHNKRIGLIPANQSAAPIDFGKVGPILIWVLVFLLIALFIGIFAFWFYRRHKIQK